MPAGPRRWEALSGPPGVGGRAASSTLQACRLPSRPSRAPLRPSTRLHPFHRSPRQHQHRRSALVGAAEIASWPRRVRSVSSDPEPLDRQRVGRDLKRCGTAALLASGLFSLSYLPKLPPNPSPSPTSLHAIFFAFFGHGRSSSQVKNLMLVSESPTSLKQPSGQIDQSLCWQGTGHHEVGAVTNEVHPLVTGVAAWRHSARLQRGAALVLRQSGF